MAFRSPFPDLTIPDFLFTDFVLGNAAAYADRPALVDGVSGRALTFGELREQVRQVATGLSRRGIVKGDVVAIWAPNMPEYAVVLHAVARLGAILTTINPAYTTEEAAFQLRDAGASVLVTTAELAPRAREVAALATRAIDIITIDPAADLPSLASIAIDADPPPVAIDPAVDVVALPYSSGTTGLPKGVMLTHRNLVANLLQMDTLETGEVRALAAVLPFFHIYGLVIIMSFGLMRGATLVTLPRFDLEGFLRILQEWPITLVHVAPPIVVALAKSPVVDRYNLSGVECVFCAAAPLGPELTAAVETRLSVRVRQGYGMTEASPITHYTAPGKERPGKVGPLAPSTEGRMVDPATGADVGVGERGEVWVRGPQVMKGYFNKPDATAQTIDADGWLHTGDIGVLDEDGYLEVVDRLKELIKVKGFQVAPAELEALLLTHPLIADAAVIPVPDEEAGERPKAIIVARKGLTTADVMAFVDSHVAHYKRLAAVAFVESIPKSPSGKILRRVLLARERAANG